MVGKLLKEWERVSLAGTLGESDPSTVHVEGTLCVSAESGKSGLGGRILREEEKEMGVVGSGNGLQER